MPVSYPLAASAIADVCAISSALILLFSRPKRLELPTTDAGDRDERLEGEDRKDPFDIATSEDMIDGYPIHEEKFWSQVKVMKLGQTTAISLSLALVCAHIGWYITTTNLKAWNPSLWPLCLQTIFFVYLLVLSVCSLHTRDVSTHWSLTIHSSVLSIFAWTVLLVAKVLPRTPRYAAQSQGPSSVENWMEWLVLLFLLIVVTISSTTNRAPAVYFPPERVYLLKSLDSLAPQGTSNVVGEVQASVASILLFSYVTPIVMLGYHATSMEIRDLPILTANLRAPYIYSTMRSVMRRVKLARRWSGKPGSGYELLYQLVYANRGMFLLQIFLSATSAVLYYAPAWFLRELVKFLELTRSTEKPQDIDRAWGWMYCGGLLLSGMLVYLITGQLWSISTTTLQLRLKIQLNSTLFAKTLIRKDIASAGSASSNAPSRPSTPGGESSAGNESKEDPVEDDFSSKAQVHTLMTTDVDRVSEFSWHFFSLVDAPIEIVIGTFFLYHLLGVSCFFGLAVTCFFLPLNHFASKVVIDAQDNLMKARDERVALMNEVLGAMRMLKFMAWERSFESRVLKIRERELIHQKQNYLIETLFNAIWNSTPVSFFHFAVVRKEVLTPSIAFTSLTVFNEMRFALNTLPETFINILQSLVSLRRIEKYLSATEIADVRSIQDAQLEDSVKLVSATISWPQTRFGGASSAPSVASTPKARFTISDISLAFPDGELSLICGKLGSGKTLLLLALLGEADILAGQLIAPRSPPDALAKLSQEGNLDNSNWIVRGICAYVPQTAWLQNDSIKNNIIFGLPFNSERYQQTIEACALVADFDIIEDGDEAEIGERGVNLSGGQKARVSLARAVYSRASIVLLDDVLSAVDAHTASHLFERCLRGPLMNGRTVVLVSHHVQLVAPGASYVVALENGRVLFTGPQSEFIGSPVMQRISHSTEIEEKEQPIEETIEDVAELANHLAEPSGQSISGESDAATLVKSVNVDKVASSLDDSAPAKKSTPRKLIEDEARAVGRVRWEIWQSYFKACGSFIYWTIFSVVILGGSLTPVLENGWLRYWSGHSEEKDGKGPLWYLTVYALVTVLGIFVQTIRWFVLYDGSIRASTVLYKRLLEAVLFANIRFHDTISKGRLLNRFGKDFEGVDSSVADNLGRTIMYALSVLVTFATVTYVGGIRFFVLACVTGALYYNVSKVYGQTSRDMRRLDSVTRSPLYSIYGETIAGVTVIRAFGASSVFLREMLRCVDTNACPYYGMWSVNRWLSVRFNMLSATIVAITGVVMLVDKDVDASFAGFALAFASTITGDLLFMVRRFVGLEQSMVALERINEFSTIAQEAPEFIEPRPSASWPERGDISVENLTIRYAPTLPNVLHNLTFDVKARSKIGVLGRTGSGKSTLALSFFRFVEATEGRIIIDGVDISKLGLTDLRSRLTIIPQDPTILSGTLRTTLDVFDEYEDHEIFEALRRVHLLPSTDEPEVNLGENTNVFRDLDSPVSEGGENFSAGEKQLLCMARAILKRAKVLFCDEATASVDYVTDELISQTIRKEFAGSTIVTIAHRLRTIIDYDKVLVMDQGHIAEYDEPSVLLASPSSKFYGLCKATGSKEFAVLKHMAEEATRARQAL
ncbi:ATP-dependent bile acid permease OS=Saccharomyces cerevisiae (strain ATCC 204508 / S288c) GN=YBT1 PE=1 SV=2 [Rhizoctonia solani AG-1 IB]|uniref:ATP-dependent bile acid permease n=2 Tax=Thanatephorus cucumeris (strain AG1-IB / isolate 7/3/14) TaxID=1108050 RepID=A0A0B7FP24_THACB|nr:ATP-dependent bile acid permease OS=Saccharomyces cerevisiae (strain ATCC 204508 / S288c) GN=YBT1 PE=1 SV=2 [Rhizoctonia solani AG-1 IB]